MNSGSLWVLGGRPGQEASGVPGPRVGYMPQVWEQGSSYGKNNKEFHSFGVDHFMIVISVFRKFRCSKNLQLLKRSNTSGGFVA